MCWSVFHSFTEPGSVLPLSIPSPYRYDFTCIPRGFEKDHESTILPSQYNHTMKPKLSIPTDRSAYQASQPLFDALRIGCSQAEAQLEKLREARDHVQRVHVKVDKEETTACVTTLFHAWQISLQQYHDIFRELSVLFQAPPGVSSTITSNAIQQLIDGMRVSSVIAENFRPILVSLFTFLCGMLLS